MPSMSRRQMLRTGAVSATVVATSTAVPSLATAATAAAVPNASSGKTARSPLTRSRFTSQLGSTFSLKSPVATWSVRLERIGDLFPVLRADDEDRFSLIFSSTEPGPPQGTFTFVRAGFEPTQLFVIPDADRRQYLAIVNRL